jgi:hypothetical protein
VQDKKMKTQASVATRDEVLPNTSEITQSLSPQEWAVVSSILTKKAGESWETVAQRAGISVRQLFTYRQSRGVRTAVASLATVLLESELPEILSAVCREAKGGNISAARLYLEYSAGLDSLQEGIKEINEFKAAVLSIIEAESPDVALRLLNELRKLSTRNALRSGDYSRGESPVVDPEAQIVPAETS